MPEDDPDPDPDGEDVEAETVEGEDSDPEAQPEIEADEQADIDLGDIDPDEIEDEAGRRDSDSDSEDSSDEDEDSGSDSDDTVATSDGSTGGKSWGDMYVTGLATVTEAAKDELGEGGSVDEGLARQIGLDEHFDEWLNEQGMGEDMPPGQAVMVGTAMFLMVELGTDSEIVGKALNGGI
jgi:hypothetical protein